MGTCNFLLNYRFSIKVCVIGSLYRFNSLSTTQPHVIKVKFAIWNTWFAILVTSIYYGVGNEGDRVQ